MLVHSVEGSGTYLTCPKPLVALATIDPSAPVVRSRTSVRRPCSVSWSVTLSRSPGFMKKVFRGSGVKVAGVDSTGLAGANERPLPVRNAKLAGSMPTTAWQALFSRVPLTGSSERLKMASAAHHLVGSQLDPPGHSTHPGG